MKLLVFLLCGLSALAALPDAAADVFPSKPVRIVVPYPISGPSDIRGTPRMSRTYRIIAQNAPLAISDVLGEVVGQAIRAETTQPVAVERLPGAATTRGANAVARAPADGHTLLFAGNDTIVINPFYFQGAEYDPVRDFALIAPIATMPFVLLARTGVPAGTVRELVAWLRPRSGEINYASSGDGSTGNLVGELFRRSARVNIVHASFNGGIAALGGLAQGQVSLVFAAAPLALAHLPSEHFRPLAVSGSKRIERLPGVATFAESGLHDVDAEGWYAVFARAETPRPATVWLRERVASTVKEPATQGRLIAMGLEPVTMSFERFAARINTEQERWAPVLRASRMNTKDGA